MKFIKTVSLTMLVVIVAANALFAQKTAQYAGVLRCRACHMSAAKGAQFKIWQESLHAQAFETLGTDAAKAVAVKAGIEGNPQEAGECLVCHQTAYGVSEDLLAKGYKTGNGIECESCHGPGSLYRAASVMNAKKYAADPEGMLAQWKELGLVIPTEENCVVCHNEKSPTFKGFDFDEYFAQIQHPNPKNPLKQ